MSPAHASRLDPRLDRPTLSRETRDNLHLLIQGIRGAETARELLLYVEKFYNFQHEIRALFTATEREIVATLHNFRDAEGEPPRRTDLKGGNGSDDAVS